MDRASRGIGLTELMEDLDSNLTYGGARKISDFEAELLDRLDDSFDDQLKSQRKVDSLTIELKRSKEELEKTDAAIGEYCSETTIEKIFLARGWQFTSEKVGSIERAVSDKEIVSLLKKEGQLTLQQIGQGTIEVSKTNLDQGTKVFKVLETGVRIQEEIKEGQTQGEK